MSEFGKLKKAAKRELEELRLTLRRAKKSKKLAPEALDEAERLAEAVRKALRDKDVDALGKTLDALTEHVDKDLLPFRPNAFWETVKALLIAVAIAVFIRWMFIEPFRIPSGSMIPTLLIGDQLMVNRMAFGPDVFVPLIDPDPSPEAMDKLRMKGAIRWSFHIAGHEIDIQARKLWTRREPRRGEVVVFRFPNNPREDYIKRVIGIPGDKIELKDRRLYINDQLQPEDLVGPYTGPNGETGCGDFELYHETLAGTPVNRVHELIHCNDYPASGIFSDYGPITVPAGTFFGMGDNRDRSSDSRSWGFAPLSHLKGTAMFIHLPLDPDRHYMPRWDRFFKRIR
jgi:signal peptidase I